MNHYDYKLSYSWPQAIELITLVNRLSDDLPAGDQDALGQELRRTAIDLATAIAVDLTTEAPPRLEFSIRLETQLEVIRRVYPALDTAAADHALAKLFDRLTSDKFTEQVPASAPAVPDADEEEAEATASTGQEPSAAIGPDVTTVQDDLNSTESQPTSATQITVRPDPSAS